MKKIFALPLLVFLLVATTAKAERTNDYHPISSFTVQKSVSAGGSCFAVRLTGEPINCNLGGTCSWGNWGIVRENNPAQEILRSSLLTAYATQTPVKIGFDPATCEIIELFTE